MKVEMETIRQAVCKNRGGLETATDAQLMTIWNSLTQQTREQYLQTINAAAPALSAKAETGGNGVNKARKEKDAVSNTSKREVQDSA